MFEKGLSIEDSKTSPFRVTAASSTQQQNIQQNTKIKLSFDNNKLGGLKSVEPGRSGRTATSKEPNEGDERFTEALRAESDEDSLEQGALEGPVLDTSNKPRKPPAPATVSNTLALFSRDSLDSKPVAHRVDTNKKLEKQIRNVQKAIKQESNRPGKANAGILKGLKNALEKLIATRKHQNQSSLSRSPEFQERTKSPEKESGDDENHFHPEPIQTVAQPETQKSPTEIEVIRSHEDIPTIEEQLPTLSALTQRPPLADAPPANLRNLTSEDYLTMTESPSLGREQGHWGRGLALVDHDMTDVESAGPDFFPLTEQCHHYTRRSDVTWDIQKYWAQRYSIFSLYDEGINMTDDSWFGVTPEPVANKVAEDLAALTPQSKSILIDMFAGAGGNVIAFALSKRWSTIIAIEKDPSVIACAQHNANIYGVYEQITWINGDSFSYLDAPSSAIESSRTVIFASPPWGGPGYKSDVIFDLNTMSPYSIKQIHGVCKGMDSALYLPRTSDLRQIAKLAPPGKKIDVVQYCMEGASKALVAYIPAVAPPAS